MVRVSSAVASHPGLRRGDNEDAYCARPDLGLYLVADGMGGHAAGEVASRTFAHAVERFLGESAPVEVPASAGPQPDPALSAAGHRLLTAFKAANREIGAAAASNASLKGMATTAAAVLVNGATGVVAHVGDSRVYRWRAGRLEQITDDHSWVNEQVRAGTLSEDDARRHPLRNVVTRALAGGADPDIDVVSLDPRPGDRVLICSDGLSGVVSLDVMAAIVGSDRTPEQACHELVAAANAAGGPDNVTVAVLHIDVD